MKSSSKPDSAKSVNINTVLKALGSSLRAGILSELATGDKYVLQLVKTLGRAQQDIHRNLNYLEELGLVTSYNLAYKEYKTTSTKPSKGRRYFRINKSFMLQINMAPTFYFLDFRALPLYEFEFKPNSENSSINIPNVEQKTISELSREISEENKKLKKLQTKQHQIFIKQTKLQNQIINLLNQYDLTPLEFVILTKLIGKARTFTEKLARELNIHPEICKNTLETLQQKIPIIQKQNNSWVL